MDPIRRAWDELSPDEPARLRWIRPVEGRGVALLLGAFDPPTRAHVAVADGVRRATGLPVAWCMTKVLLDRPPDTLLDPAERLELLDELGAEHRFGLAIANRGTYLEVSRAASGAGVDASFVVGSDKLPRLADPSFYPDGERGVAATFAEVRFLVVPRGTPVDRSDVTVLDPDAVFRDPETASVSASEVRRRLRSGEDVTDLVPPVVGRRLGGYTGAREPGWS